MSKTTEAQFTAGETVYVVSKGQTVKATVTAVHPVILPKKTGPGTAHLAYTGIFVAEVLTEAGKTRLYTTDRLTAAPAELSDESLSDFLTAAALDDSFTEDEADEEGHGE